MDRYNNQGSPNSRFSDLTVEEQSVIVQDVFNKSIERTGGQTHFAHFTSKLQAGLEESLLTEVKMGRRGIR